MKLIHLKKGDSGDIVEIVQSRLQQLRYLPKSYKCNGDYGEVLTNAVQKFQLDRFPMPKGLNKVQRAVYRKACWNGEVGPKTWAALWPAPFDRSTPLKTVWNFFITRRRKYPFPPGYSLNEKKRKQRYGSTPVEVQLQLENLNFLGHRIKISKLHLTQFKAVETRIRQYEKDKHMKAYYPEKVHSYQWRPMRGSATRLSNHCFGIAVDIDWERNPLTANQVMIEEWKRSNVKIPKHVIEAFEKEGIRWGGRFESHKDFTHFEC